jgi:hypothetical protein
VASTIKADYCYRPTDSAALGPTCTKEPLGGSRSLLWPTARQSAAGAGAMEDARGLLGQGTHGRICPRRRGVSATTAVAGVFASGAVAPHPHSLLGLHSRPGSFFHLYPFSFDGPSQEPSKLHGRLVLRKQSKKRCFKQRLSFLHVVNHD